jgi:hypothetical protein
MDRFTVGMFTVLGAIFIALSALSSANPDDLPKIVVIGPNSALPDGGTLVVSGASFLRPFDSPDAHCARCGTPNFWCRDWVVKHLLEKATIHATLPYSSALLRFTGAPEALTAYGN